MVKRTGPTNVNLKSLISELNKLGVKEKSNLWKRLASDLSKPTRQKREVNVEKINQYAREGETVVVPGKVLAEGDVDKKLTVAAWTFSESAKAKISKKGKTMTIAQLMKENPKGKKVRILG
ncbi:MAG: 50S ribosomal protein L18e [Candidatus Woesearchaeota archaeon]